MPPSSIFLLITFIHLINQQINADRFPGEAVVEVQAVSKKVIYLNIKLHIKY